MQEEIMNDFEFLATQSLAIAEALQTDEDKLYWTASTSLGSMLQLVPKVFEPIIRQFIGSLPDLYAQAVTGSVTLPAEFKELIQSATNKCYLPEIMEIQKNQLAEAYGFMS